MPLVADLERISRSLVARDGEALTAILATEPAIGSRAYVCAFQGPGGRRSWLVLDAAGVPVRSRRDARDAVTIAALCEIAEEAAFTGDLDELRSQLLALRLTEAPDGVEAAEEAAHALQHAVGSPPQLATPARLDELGQAAYRLERAFDPTVPSPFAAAMRSAQGVVDALWDEVESSYLGPLE